MISLETLVEGHYIATGWAGVLHVAQTIRAKGDQAAAKGAAHETESDADEPGEGARDVARLGGHRGLAEGAADEEGTIEDGARGNDGGRAGAILHVARHRIIAGGRKGYKGRGIAGGRGQWGISGQRLDCRSVSGGEIWVWLEAHRGLGLRLGVGVLKAPR